MDLSQIILTNIRDRGNDILFVEAVYNGKKYEAQGWISAMTNYYSPDQYDQNGMLIEGATPREMTKEEKQIYCKNLINEQNPLSDQNSLSDIL